MAAEHLEPHGIAARSTQPLVCVFVEEDSDLVQYFIDDESVSPPQHSDDIQAALSVIGAWSDMDWEELAESLDRIRHENPPTPPIDL